MIIKKVAESRLPGVNFNELFFGKHYADHMLVAEYANGQWGEMRIEAYDKIPFYPSISALHYGQAIFEGLKAYRGADNKVRLFRQMDNWKRMNKSAERMGMPAMPEEFFSEGLLKLLSIDKAWVPNNKDQSLYIRPVLFATDDKIGVHTSSSYHFVIFCCPVAAYYTKPMKTLAETSYIRSALGGVGFAKAAGNYGGVMFPTTQAQNQGFDQIIWLDAAEKKYLEEAGTMNILAMIDNKLVTPPTGDTTLSGITRDSILQLASHWNMVVEERPLSINEVIEGAKNGKLQELFGAGTAATVTPIQEVSYLDTNYTIPVGADDSFSKRVSKELLDIRRGESTDIFGWMTEIQ